jgi:histidinol-phosphate phosphatase family protein
VPYNRDPERVVPVDGAAEALARLRGAGVGIAVVSNQSGVARGLLTPLEVEAVNARTDALLGPLGPVEWCPHGPDDGCGCRKPAPGLVLRAAARLGVDPRCCAVVGDIGADVEAAQAAGAAKIVFSSASSVYGDTHETMDERHPLDARTMYGASKIAGEYLLRAFNDRDGLPYVTLRYMNVYGPRQQGGLIMSVLGRLLAGERPVIEGDGSASFDFVHVADVAEANVAAMAADASGVELNVGSGTEASVREVVEKLIELTGAGVEPEYRPAEHVSTIRRVGSSARARELLGWSARRDLDSGLREVVESVRRR